MCGHSLDEIGCMAFSQQKRGAHGKGSSVVWMAVILFELVDAVDPLGGFEVRQKDGHGAGLFHPKLISRAHHGVFA